PMQRNNGPVHLTRSRSLSMVFGGCMNKHSERVVARRKTSPPAGPPRGPGCPAKTLRPCFNPDRVAVRLGRYLFLASLVFILHCGGAAMLRADWPLVRGDAAATGAVADDLPQSL